MRKISVNRLLLTTVLFGIFANLAHPITPAFLKELQMPNYMFGVAFAFMALSSFLFASSWGRSMAKHGSILPMVIGYIGYAVAQYLFLCANEPWKVMIARFVGGIFVSPIQIAQLVYIKNNSDSDKVNQNLLLNATLITVFACIGYLVGGVIGEYSLSLVFYVQIIGLAGIGVLTFFILEDPVREEVVKEKKVKIKFGPILFYLFLAMLFSSLATTSYEQSFNYFLRDQFNFSTSYNGILKAVTGIASLIANATIGMWLLKKTEVRKSLVNVFLVCSSFTLILIFSTNQWLFLSINLILSVLNILYQPLLQSITTEESVDNHSVVISKMQAMKSIGMIAGGLASGFLYMIHPTVPFYLTLVCFAISAFCVRKSKKAFS